MWYQDARILKLNNPEQMKEILKEKGKLLSSFQKGTEIHVWNKMAKGYSYTLNENPGQNMDPSFKPYATPGEILAMGAFEGKYLNDCLLEFPAEWYWNALLLDKLRPGKPDVSVNLLGVDSRQTISFWIRSGWLPGGHKKGQHPELSDAKINPDERGWFQWYCRYWMGRRLPVLDTIQIKRWKSFTRHLAQVKQGCHPMDMECRKRQRQGLFQWAYNPYV